MALSVPFPAALVWTGEAKEMTSGNIMASQMLDEFQKTKNFDPPNLALRTLLGRRPL